MRIRIIALALLIAGCAPTPSAVDPAAPVQSLTAEACTARGGKMQPVGRLQTMQCVVRYADAGKRCTDGDQCQGDCRVEGNGGVTEGAASAGVCQVTSDRFGCFTTIEDGKAAATLCID